MPPYWAANQSSLSPLSPFQAVAVGEVVRKLLGYSLVRPAREVLFTVVSREEKYKAKLTIDAVVQRLGDTVAALVFEILGARVLRFGPGPRGGGRGRCCLEAQVGSCRPDRPHSCSRAP